MTYVFDEWVDKLDNLSQKVASNLAEVRKCKQEVQEMRTEIFNAVAAGYYRRDDKRIVLSAPEIIIGDVDKEGNLWMGGQESTVIIRSNNIKIEGVAGDYDTANGNVIGGGSITCKAPVIKQMAVDAGPSGIENVVSPTSQIVTLGKNIKISTIDTKGVLPSGAESANEGVTIHSGKTLELDASVPNSTLKTTLSTQKTALEGTKGTVQGKVNALKADVDNSITQLKRIYDDSYELVGDSVEKVRNNSMELWELRSKMEDILPVVYANVTAYIEKLTELANLNREIQSLESEITALDSASGTYATETTGASVKIKGESISLSSVDGDGHDRTNKDAMITANAPKVSITALKHESANVTTLMPGSSFTVQAENMDFNASAVTDDTANKKKTTEPKGVINIQTKELNVSSYKVEEKYDANGVVTEKQLVEHVAESKLAVSVPDVKLTSKDKDGKATGKFLMNFKAIAVASADTEKDSDKPKGPAAEGIFGLLAEKIILGSKEENQQGKHIVMHSQNLLVKTKEQTVLDNNEGKAVVKLSGEKIELTGSEVEEKGKLTVNGETTFKKDVSGAGAKFKEVTASSHLKGPKIDDK